MSKNAYFIGQPVFTQIINLIPKSILDKTVIKFNSDRYIKRFKTFDHLIAMLYCSFAKCESLREVIIGMQVSMNRLSHLGLDYSPRRSTLSDANKRRTHEVFEFIFHELVKYYFPVLSDSSKAKTIEDKLFLMDSTTVSLFSEIMKGAGSYKNNGRKKGGAKAHVLLKAKEDVPVFVHMTEGKEHDLKFMHIVPLSRGSYVVFDKAYNNSSILHKWTENDINWVTRMNASAKITSLTSLKLTSTDHIQGVFNDQVIKTGRKSNKTTTQMILRLVSYYDFEKQRVFEFLTNNFEMPAYQVAQLYKRRWQIELMFKRWKANNPLKYFLGDNENAIKIQMWSAMIADLLTQVIRIKLKELKSQWSFSNLAGLLRQHLFTYINLFYFLKKPDQVLLQNRSIENSEIQLSLFDSS